MPEEKVARLIQELKHKDWGRRADAAAEMGQIGDPAAVLPLCQALQDRSSWEDDPREMVRDAVVAALVKIGAPSVLPLCEVLKDGTAGARERAVEALGKIRDPRAVLPLCEALRERGIWDVRGRAATALGKFGALAVDPLCEALRHEDPEVRALATEALSKIGDAGAVPALCAALRDEDWSVRSSAAFALGEIGDAEAVLPLCEALQHGSLELRHYAAQALGQISDPRAVLPLYDARGDKNAAVRARVAEALGRIVLREPASEALVQLGAPAVLPLCEILKDGNIEARCQAAMVLARIAERDAVPELRAAVPPLRRLLTQWHWRDDQEEQVYQTALERIEAATAAMDLPLPAEAPPPSPETLPIPATPFPPDPDGLPIPASDPDLSPDAPSPLPSPFESVERLLDSLWKWVRGGEQGRRRNSHPD
jgi:HEAT repeat protein